MRTRKSHLTFEFSRLSRQARVVCCSLTAWASFLEGFYTENILVELEKFTAPGKEAAVVVVVDNDKGGEDIYNTIRKLTKKKALKSDAYLHVAGKSVCGPHTAEGRSHEVNDRGLFR